MSFAMALVSTFLPADDGVITGVIPSRPLSSAFFAGYEYLPASVLTYVSRRAFQIDTCIGTDVRGRARSAAATAWSTSASAPSSLGFARHAVSPSLNVTGRWNAACTR